MAQSLFSLERERLVEVNRLLPDIRDFLRDVIKKESLSSEIIEQCDGYIDRLDAIIQPPSLPPRSGRSATISYDQQHDDFLHARLSEQQSKGSDAGEPADHAISPEYLEQQRELSRKATMWKNEQLPHQPLPYNSKRKTASIRDEILSSVQESKSSHHSDDRASAIYEVIFSSTGSIEHDVVSSVIKSNTPVHLAEPPPVPERKGRSYTTLLDKTRDERTVVMVHDLKDPLYSGLLCNVRMNMKQWGVIISQKLFLFDDLERPAVFIGDLRFYEVMKDHVKPYTFHVTGNDFQSIILAAVNDAQYQLWYNAFQRAKIISDAAVGKFDGSGEMAEYVSIGDDDFDEFDENDYEKPNDFFNLLSKPVHTSESYMEMNSPRKSSSASVDYEVMEQLSSSQDQLLPQVVEREDSWQSQESYTCAEDRENQDYNTMPLPPLPPPQDDVPPELPVRGHKANSSLGFIGASMIGKPYKSEDEASLSDNLAAGSQLSLDSESENDVIETVPERSSSIKVDTLPTSTKLKRMRETEFLNDDTALFTGILHKRKILAVWQKHYCKIKDEYLLCYRNLDNLEASYEIKLPGYQLDRADETWRNFSFKIHNNSDVLYFAAENRAELVKWLNILAREMNKEKFVAIRDPDLIDMPQEKRFKRQESTDESEGSPQNVHQSKQDDINDHTSDFDADNESGGSEASEKKNSITEQLPKNFLQVSKNRRLRGREEDSPEEPDAQIQGYLFRKLQNHWTRRWCSIKEKKFFIYRHSPRELPEVVVILQFAALTIPDDGITRSGGWYLFKITYEAEETILLSTKCKEDWVNWTKCIEEFVGSLSEEPFPYINVPASSTLQKNINSHFFPTDEDEVDDFNSFAPEAVSSPLDGHDFTTSELTLLSSSAPAGKLDMVDLSHRETELANAYYKGFMTEIQIHDNRIEPVELFVVLTKEKLLKFYSEQNSSVPLITYNALTIEVINEAGADACILRLSIPEENNKEILLKVQDQHTCEQWKENFNLIHYAEIEDNIGSQRESIYNESAYGDKTVHEKLFRKRSKSIDKKTKNEPILISHSKTLPHMGRNKKRAKEQNATAKSKRLSYQRSEEHSVPSKKGLSSFIRSLTVDTLGRKAKNKSFECTNDILLKETQHGHVREVVVTKDSVTHESRFCRISGKVLYCYSSKADSRHIWKVSLKNAAIQDEVDANCLFKIKITAFDTGEEYNLLFDSESDLENWISALSGEDKLHYSGGSPQIARANASPVTKVRSETIDLIPPHPSKVHDELSPPVARREPIQLSPPFSQQIPSREFPKPGNDSPLLIERKHLSGTATTINKTPLTSSPSLESPPVPKRNYSRDVSTCDVEDTPFNAKGMNVHKETLTTSVSVDSPYIPKRIQSRASYKDRSDISLASLDHISLSGSKSDINKRQSTTALLNNQESTLSPPVPRRTKHKNLPKPEILDDIPQDIPLLTESNITSHLDIKDKKLLGPTLSGNQELQDTAVPPVETNKNLPNNVVEMDGPTKWLPAFGGSLSSLSSSNTTSTLSSTITTSTLSETEILARSKSKEQKLSEDDVLLEEFMHEIRQKELSKTKLLRWLVLRKTVLEVYNNEHEKTPCKVINMENSFLISNEKTVSAGQLLTVQIKDSEGFITQFLPQNENVYKRWVSQIKSIEKGFRRTSKTSTSKLPIVGDIMRRRDRDRIKNLKLDEDKRKSLLLVEEDYKAVKKYEESTDLSRTIAGTLVEYFDDDKPENHKHRHCWINDGFFYIAKVSKSQKAIKKIDLSTVVILDESEPSKHSYAFKLNYTKDGKDRSIMLKAPNQSTADKWMVSVSMGILLHRLKSPQVRTSFEIMEPSDKDHEFVPLPSSVALTINTPTYTSNAEDFELGIDIKRELAKKAEQGEEEHLLSVSELLRNEFPTPQDSPLQDRKEESSSNLLQEKDGIDGEVEKNENPETGEDNKNEAITISDERLSDTANTHDFVFSDQEETLEMLENIPDRDNADERFKNVRGILKQQESIRRAIIHRQKSNASQKGYRPTKKKIPPKTKPKPNTRNKKSSSSSLDTITQSFVVIKDHIDNLSMTELQTYNEQLGCDKTSLLNFIKELDKEMERKSTCNTEQVTNEVGVPTETENQLSLARNILQTIDHELGRVNSTITRYVSMKIGKKKGDCSIYNSPHTKNYSSAECLLVVDRQSHLYEKGYASEPSYDEDNARTNGRRCSYEETNSIII